MAADVTRELVTRRGRALRTSLLFLVRFRSASSPPEDYIYSQSLAGLASTAQLVHRLHVSFSGLFSYFNETINRYLLLLLLFRLN